MNPYPFTRPLGQGIDAEACDSCLTINLAGAPLGLSNLLELIEHDISIDCQRQTHRLKFRSGEVLYVHADSQAVTVRGSRVKLQPWGDPALHTVISDPAG